MGNHVGVSAEEAADRLALRELVEAYAHCADRRDALAPVFADLNQYAATMHFVGQSTIFTLDVGRATGEAYCIAHHLMVDGEKRQLLVAYLRYLDTFAHIDGTWLFAERLLYVDWLEERSLS